MSWLKKVLPKIKRSAKGTEPRTCRKTIRYVPSAVTTTGSERVRASIYYWTPRSVSRSVPTFSR